MKLEIQFTSQEAADRYTGSGNLYGSADAAGLDLRAAIEHPISILPSEQVFIQTGIKANLMALSHGQHYRHAAIAMPRSGRGSREGLVLGNTVGLIDQDYHGEIMLCCWHRPTSGHINGANNRVGGTPIHIEPWERIAQLVIVPVLRPEIVAVRSFSVETDRGSGGFGSTGN